MRPQNFTSIFIQCVALLFAAYAYADSFESGPYLGIGLGYDFNYNSQRDLIDDVVYRGDRTDSKMALEDKGLSGTLFFGYLHKLEGSPFTVSVEPFIQYSQASQSSLVEIYHSPTEIDSYRTKTTMGWSVGSVVKLGYICKKRDLMFYGLVGGKMTQVNSDRYTQSIDDGELIDEDGFSFDRYYLKGFMCGVGVEKQIGENRIAIELVKTIYSKHTAEGIWVDDDESFRQEVIIKPRILSITLRYIILL